MIQNRRDFRRYYGSTSLSAKQRWELHRGLLRNNKHYTPLLQEAYNEYGEEEFEFSVIATQLDKKSALLLEKQSCEQTADFCYNMTYVKTGTEHPNWKREHSQEQKEAQSKRALGTKRNDETKAKMRKTAIERSRHLSLLDSIENKKTPIKDTLGNIFPSLSEAAEFHGIKVMTACDIVKGRHTYTRQGVSLKLVSDETPWPPNHRVIYCSNGKIYNSAKQASSDTGCTIDQVNDSIRGRRAPMNGRLHFWKTNNE